MSFRTAYGNEWSENGWRMVDQAECEWVTPVPGVTIQLRKGVPATILGAFAKRFNDTIEPLRDADTGGWTLVNDVPTSNHLAGTAMDLNWQSHPFHIKGTFGNKLDALIKLLKEFEGCVWWGGDWQDPIDEMHFQLNYEEGDQRLTDFAKKLDICPWSPSTPEPPIDAKGTYVLAIIKEGQDRGISPRGIQIALATAIVESNLVMYANSSVPASLNLPHEAVGSDYDSVGLFQQRCPMWGPVEVLMDPARAAGLFYDNLVNFDYNDESQSPGSFAQSVQRSAFPDRYDEHWDEAVALYQEYTHDNHPVITDKDGFLMALTDAEQRELLDLARQQSGIQRTSRSPLRHVGEGPVETISGFEWNTDANVHVLVVALLARLGHPDTLKLLNEVATNTVPDRQQDKKLAQAILNWIAQVSVSTNSTPMSPVQPTPPPVTVTVPLAAPTVAPLQTSGAGLYSEVNSLRSLIRDVTNSLSSTTKGE